MLKELTDLSHIYLAYGKTDLRKGIDGLAQIVQADFGMDPFQDKVLFLFCGNRKDRIKGLLWEGDGFILLYKRLETGRFEWPRNSHEAKEISRDQYDRLLEGLSIEPVSPRKTCHFTTMI